MTGLPVLLQRDSTFDRSSRIAVRSYVRRESRLSRLAYRYDLPHLPAEADAVLFHDVAVNIGHVLGALGEGPLPAVQSFYASRCTRRRKRPTPRTYDAGLHFAPHAAERNGVFLQALQPLPTSRYAAAHSLRAVSPFQISRHAELSTA